MYSQISRHTLSCMYADLYTAYIAGVQCRLEALSSRMSGREVVTVVAVFVLRSAAL